MYSLGIISFEMSHAPFVTETERRIELTKLRESDHESLSRIVLASITDEVNKIERSLKWLFVKIIYL